VRLLSDAGLMRGFAHIPLSPIVIPHVVQRSQLLYSPVTCLGDLSRILGTHAWVGLVNPSQTLDVIGGGVAVPQLIPSSNTSLASNLGLVGASSFDEIAVTEAAARLRELTQRFSRS